MPKHYTEVDQPRLRNQRDVIREFMLSLNEVATAAAAPYCQWATLEEIAKRTRYPQASISAQLRHLRRGRNGTAVFEKHLVEKRPRGERKNGLWEYRVSKWKEAAA